MNRISSIFALLLCFCAFLNLDSVKGFEVNKPYNLSNEIKISKSGGNDSFEGFDFNKLIDFKEEFVSAWEQNSKLFDDAVNNWTEVNSFFFGNKACDFYKKMIIDLESNKCIEDIVNDWKEVDNIEKQNCCSYYDFFDCKISSAKRLCDSSVFDEVHKIEVENMKDQAEFCPDYGHKSYKCNQNVRNLNHFPVWLTILIIFLVIGFIVVFVSFVIKMRKLFLPKTFAQQ
jgi:hypothetical protein